MGVYDKSKLSSEQTLFKYMDLEKFLSLIVRNEICFCNQKGLKEIDPYEGAIIKSELIQEYMARTLLEYCKRQDKFDFINIETPNKNIKIDINNIENYKIYDDGIFYIDCWHINQYESLAMWRVFSNNRNSIAINTTKDKLIKSIKENDKNIYLEKVSYNDLTLDKKIIGNPVGEIRLDKYRTLHIKSGDYFNWTINTGLLRKAKYYEYEHELRLYFEDRDNDEQVKFIKVDLNSLIDEIIISPDCDEWFVNILNDVLKKYSINKKVRFSDIRQSNFILSDEEREDVTKYLSELKFHKVDK